MMNYVLKPTLEHIALVKVAAVLWRQHDIRALVVNFSNSQLFMQMDDLWKACDSQKTKGWRKVEDRVVKKVSRLTLPVPLKKKMLGYIQAAGLQILKWMEYHRKSCCFHFDLPDEFCWTPQGTIDEKKTAEVLIKDNKIDITTRYKLACVYCLEDEIPQLWNKIPESGKKPFCNKKNPEYVKQLILVHFWTYNINKFNKKKLHPMYSYQFAFQSAANSGNKVAVQYFLQKLTPCEKDMSLLRTALNLVQQRNRYHKLSNAPREYYNSVLMFLLSQMDSEEQEEVLQIGSFHILRCFLDWPWQCLFLETANYVWNFLSYNCYQSVLHIIINKIIDGYKDFDYQRLFGELWQQIPNLHKSYIIDSFSIVLLLCWLLQTKDKENIKRIFQSASLMEKKNLIFSDRGRYICEDMIFYSDLGILKFFLREFLLSKDEVIKFKEEMREHMTQRFSKVKLAKVKDNCNKFFMLLNGLIREFNKRKCTKEGDSCLSKRLCTAEFNGRIG